MCLSQYTACTPVTQVHQLARFWCHGPIYYHGYSSKGTHPCVMLWYLVEKFGRSTWPKAGPLAPKSVLIRTFLDRVE